MTIRPVPDTVRKVDALQSAIRGDVLTEEDGRTLAAIVEDYLFIFDFGNGKVVGREHVLEAFKILVQDVKYMTGERRRQTIILLNAVRARGFDQITAKDLSVNDYATNLSEDMASDVDADELAEAISGN